MMDMHVVACADTNVSTSIGASTSTVKSTSTNGMLVVDLVEILAIALDLIHLVAIAIHGNASVV